MLSLNMKTGEYITIADNIVIQVLPDGGRATLLVDAPRELLVLRGRLREEAGEAKPESIRYDHPKRIKNRGANAAARSEKYFTKVALWQRRKDAAGAALERMNALLDDMDDTPERAELRALCEQILPMLDN